jgi:hypothetical protein
VEATLYPEQEAAKGDEAQQEDGEDSCAALAKLEFSTGLLRSYPFLLPATICYL